MGFRGQSFAFDSPAAAIAGLIARLRGSGPACGPAPGTEIIPLHTARGRILAQSVACDRDNPAFDYASMDGYAVRATDVRAAAAMARAKSESTITLTVTGESRIGVAPPFLLPTARGPDSNASALRIATGAAIPMGKDGTDAVIKREDVVEHATDAHSRGAEVRAVTLAVDFADRVASGDFIRRRGENAQTGDIALSAGEVLTASSLGALAAVGCVQPPVFARLRVALITTGEELVPAHQTPGAHQIRNSSAHAIAAALASQAWIDVVHESHMSDDADLAAALRALTAPETACQAIILTGGVSMGHRDPVRAAVESLDAEIIFHGLPQRPGKPMLAALHRAPSSHTVPVFGLPGNPVSALVTCARIVLPVLAACAGARRTPATLLPRLVGLASDDSTRLPLWWHRPATLRTRDDGLAVAELVNTRGSGDIIAAAQSDGFVELPPVDNAAAITPNTLVPFYPWPA